MASYKGLAAAVISMKQDAAKTATREAALLENTATKISALAEASSEKIKDSLKAKSTKKKPIKKKTTKKGSKLMLYVILAIVVLFILLAIFGKKSETEYYDAEFGSERYSVNRNNDRFNSGSFWADGQHYRTQDHYYRRHGVYYTNAMYLDNYDRWGRGQGRDLSLDSEVRAEIEERQELREEAAEASYEAEESRLDAAEENEDVAEIEESLATL